MTTFTGTAGDDSILGSADNDVFHLEQGGDDIARGRAGDDTFFMGGAFTGADQIDGGGGGGDVVVLDGDYSAGATITAASLTAIETVRLTGGHSYHLTVEADAAGTPYIDALGLGAGDSLRLDASATTRGLRVDGGVGDDTLIGGSGADQFFGGHGSNLLVGGAGSDSFELLGSGDVAKGGAGGDLFRITEINAGTGNDRLIGGAGVDFLTISTGGVLVFSDTTIQSIEHLLIDTGPLDLTMADGNVVKGHILHVVTSGAGIRFDGSLESDSRYYVTTQDSAQSTTLIGGAGDDTLSGASVADLIVGGGGDDHLFTGDVSGTSASASDTLIGGLGQDKLFSTVGGGACHFVFQDIADSASDAPDLIVGLDNHHDIIDLSAIDADLGQDGDQAFELVSAFSGHAGQLVVHYDAGTNRTSISADVDGDATADMVIEVKGSHEAFAGFVL